MNTIQKLPKLKGDHVLIRVDYNVPIVANKIKDARRIEASYETIDAVLKKGGTPILIAHLGDATASLRPVATFLSKKYKIVFVTQDITDPKIHTIITAVPKGTVILLENIRRYTGEEKNDVGFVKTLAGLGEYFVNDAFSVSHRKHASVVGIAKKLPSFAGMQLQKEIKALHAVVTNKKHPFLFILGGSKFETKIPLLKRFSALADNIVIAGAILNSFYKEAGFPIGKSVAEDGYEKPIATLLKNPTLLLPVDCLVLRDGKTVTITPDEVEKDDVIVDIGSQSVALIAAKMKTAKLIVWNGPTGWYEKGFTKATINLAKAAIASNAQTVIGGGDTGAVVEKIVAKTDSKKVFVSTGGGATLEYLANATLPGIAALG